jgi:hypothetical protein
MRTMMPFFDQLLEAQSDSPLNLASPLFPEVPVLE